MKSTFAPSSARVIGVCAAAAAPLVFAYSATLAEEKLTQPVYRVTNETAAAQPAVAAQPVAYATTDERPDFTGWPDFPYGLSSMTLARGDLAAFAADARDMGVRYIGSCCGSVAEHVRAMAKVLEKRPAQEREWRSQTGKAMSAYEYYDHVETEV